MPKGLKTKAKKLRDKVLVQLLLYTGVRVSELVSIRIWDIDFLSHQVKVIGKGCKYREIPLKPELLDTIKKYIVERRQNPYYKLEYLLLGQRGALGRDAINRILSRITKGSETAPEAEATCFLPHILYKTHRKRRRKVLVFISCHGLRKHFEYRNENTEVGN